MTKITTALTAIAILGCGAAFAAPQTSTTPSTTTPSATTPSATTPSASTPAAPSATPVKKVSLKACNKKADEQKLTGKDRSKFVKECRAGKSS
jgi:hypothetical protein